MRDDLTEVVERLSQRKVIAFMSHNHIDPDLASELFVLAPRDRDAPLRRRPRPDPGPGVSSPNGWIRRGRVARSR